MKMQSLSGRLLYHSTQHIQYNVCVLKFYSHSSTRNHSQLACECECTYVCCVSVSNYRLLFIHSLQFETNNKSLCINAVFVVSRFAPYSKFDGIISLLRAVNCIDNGRAYFDSLFFIVWLLDAVSERGNENRIENFKSVFQAKQIRIGCVSGERATLRSRNTHTQ